MVIMDEIKRYLSDAGLTDSALDRKLEQYSRHQDIAKEFLYWIINNKYMEDGVEIEGYTAYTLGNMSEYLTGEGSFSLMIMLREKPEKALKKISEGFRIK